MTRVLIPNELTINRNLLEQTPYSAYYNKKLKCYEYEIINYGFEHLIPQVLIYELSHGVDSISIQIESTPRCLDGVFQIDKTYESILKLIKQKYLTSDVLDFTYDSELRISEVKPLKKLLKAQNPIQVATLILDYCFTCLQLKYHKNHPYKFYKEFNLSEGEYFTLLDYQRLQDHYPNYVKSDLIKIPGLHMYFSSVIEAIHHYLQFKYSNTSKPLIDVEPLTHPNFLTLLRTLGLKEYNLLHIGNCPFGVSLKNPTSNLYSFFCEDPFICLGDNKPSKGWAIVRKKLYVWGDNESLKENVKRGCVTFLGCKLLKRSQPGVNLLTLKEEVIGSLKSSTSGFILTMSLYFKGSIIF